MNQTATATKFTITTCGYTYTARDAAGNIAAIATFEMPRTYEGCRLVMAERAAWLRRWL